MVLIRDGLFHEDELAADEIDGSKKDGSTAIDSEYDDEPDMLYHGPQEFGEQAAYAEPAKLEDTKSNLNTYNSFWAAFNAATNPYIPLGRDRDIPPKQGSSALGHASGNILTPDASGDEEFVLFVDDSNQPNDTIVLRAMDKDGVIRKVTLDDLSSGVVWD